MAYYELWSILGSWKREFTLGEFRFTFPSPSPNKVLHDMVQKGFLENISKGMYRVNSPREYLEKKFNIGDTYDLVKEAKLKYAFTGPDAVFFWTKGGYNVDRFFGFYPIHLKIERRELENWKTFFMSRDKKMHINGESIKQMLLGAFYVVYLDSEFKTEDVDGFKVIPLDETIKFCEKNIYAYEPALEMINELYNLELKIRYKETETNFKNCTFL
jgi:hypothetical protein